MYIGNVFKNPITVIEKNYIAIHIDTELLSSPRYEVEKENQGKKRVSKILRKKI